MKHLEGRSGSKRFKFVVPHGGKENLAHPESEQVEEYDGGKRFKFVLPHGGGAPSPDPIAVFRGARRPDLAKKFIEYVVSIDGQKLIAFNAGTDGGPVKITMCRTPILKTVYGAEYGPFRVNPDLNPYEAAASFVAHDDWMNPVFPVTGLIIKLAFLDNNIELVNAWGAILRAREQGRIREAEAAEKIMADLSSLDYENVIDSILPAMNNRDISTSLRFQNNLCDSFRKRYILAKSVAEGIVCPGER
jgi:hypothetical protein